MTRFNTPDSGRFPLTLRLSAVFVTLGVLLSVAGCSHSGSSRKEKAENDRRAWRQELNDSAAAIERRISDNAETIRTLTEDIDQMLADFTKIDNPRHVEAYYILSAAAAKYPLMVTGLAARLTLSERLELIAALQGGVFSRIRVSGPSGAVESETVPYDGALNYRGGGLTTVAFSGGACDSVGRFIALHEGTPLKVEFLEGGRVTGIYTLPDNVKKGIAQTWRLADARERLDALERLLPLDNAKLESVRMRLEKDSTDTPAKRQ